MNLEIFIFFQYVYFLANHGAMGLRPKIQIHIFKGREIFSPKSIIDEALHPLFPRVYTKTTNTGDNFDKKGHQDRCITPENKPGVCKEFSECSRLYHSLPPDVNDWHIFKCWIPGQGEIKPNGFCCPAQEINLTTSPTSSSTFPSTTTEENTNFETKSEDDLDCKYEKTHTLPCFENIEELNVTILRSSLKVAERIKVTEDLLIRQRAQEDGFRFSGKVYMESESTFEVSNFTDVLIETSKEIASRIKLGKRQKIFGLKRVNSTIFPELGRYCIQNPVCKVAKYRSIDGSCNNLQIPRQGQSYTPLRRIIPPSYADGLVAPRVASDCSSLPAAPILSKSFTKVKNIPSDRHSLFFVQFWQFLFSDFGSTRTARSERPGIKCCQHPEEVRDKRCYPIETRDDPLRNLKSRCTDFFRAQLSPRIDCSLGYADQMNEGTHWIDLSNLYGSNTEEANQLRHHRNGLLRYSRVSGKKNLLPLRETSGDDCTIPEQGIFCFHSGDRKVNDLTGLLVTHLIWFREHNRIASELKSINIEWSDEELYQEARRIVIAEYHHIIYNEWIPLFIGKNSATRTVQQNILKEELFDGDSSVSNEFFSAAFRIDHSLEQGIIHLINEFKRNNESTDSIARINYNNPHSIRSHGQVDKWIKGLSRQPSQFPDSTKIFHTDEQPKGFLQQLDLGSFIIQRGRDAGLPGYNFYRDLCFRTRVKRFEDMNDFIDEEMIKMLKQHYKNVDDVDLWIGGLLEKPLSGQFVGPTFACIIDDQFFRSKQGDKYFYDIRDHLHSFSEDQLSEIRKTTFARILCDNGDSLNETQPSAFLLPHDKTNPTVSCSDIKRVHEMDLSLWENEPTPPEAIRLTSISFS